MKCQGMTAKDFRKSFRSECSADSPETPAYSGNQMRSSDGAISLHKEFNIAAPHRQTETRKGRGVGRLHHTACFKSRSLSARAECPPRRTETVQGKICRNVHFTSMPAGSRNWVEKREDMEGIVMKDGVNPRLA
jgi:hypothetical protein